VDYSGQSKEDGDRPARRERSDRPERRERRDRDDGNDLD
jgi:hypothetical protein